MHQLQRNGGTLLIKSLITSRKDKRCSTIDSSIMKSYFQNNYMPPKPLPIPNRNRWNLRVNDLLSRASSHM